MKSATPTQLLTVREGGRAVDSIKTIFIRRMLAVMAIGISIILVVAVVVYFIYIKPVDVGLLLIAEIEVSKVQRAPIWWAHINEENKDRQRPLDETVIVLLSEYDYSQGDLIISWGRPLESMKYRRIDYIMNDEQVHGIPTFRSVDTPTTVYIYSTTDTNCFTLRNFRYYYVE